MPKPYLKPGLMFKFKVKPRANGNWDIKNLTTDEMLFLRDLMGRFADNPGDGGIRAHFHTHLMCRITSALGLSVFYKNRWKITGHEVREGVVLHCKRNEWL
jgi:hypothetical protein